MEGSTTNLNTGSGSNTNYGLPGQTGQAGQTGSTAANFGNFLTSSTAGFEDDQWQDIISFAGAANTTFTFEAPPAYVTYSDRAILTPSTVNDPIGANRTIDLIQHPPQEVMVESMTNFLTTLAGTATGTTENDADPYANIVVTDPEILALAAETGIPAAKIQENVQTEQTLQFLDLVKDLPQSDVDKLTFAFYNPDVKMDLSPELQTKLATIKQQVQTGVTSTFNFSADWQGVPVDGTDFQNKFTNEVDNNFQKALDALISSKIADGSLKPEDAEAFGAKLTAMHNGLATGTTTLKGLLKTLEGEVTAQMQAKFGFDASYQPKGDILYYNSVVNGAFAQTYQQKVARFTGLPPATPAQLALLEQYAGTIAANPNDPSIPESIRSIVAQQQLLLKAYPDPKAAGLPADLTAAAETILTESTNEIIAKFQLDTTWKPTVTSIIVPGSDRAKINLLTNGIAMAKEALSLAADIGNRMPEGPEKTQFLAYLKVISAALSALQDAVYAMQAAQSNTMGKSNRGKLDMQLNDLEQAGKASKETQEKLKKMASMNNPGLKALMWIVKIALLLISIWFGPFAFAAALAFFMDSVVSAAMGSKQTGFDKLMALMSKDLPPAAATALKMILILAVACVNPWMALELFCSETNVIGDAMAAFGADKKAQGIAQAVISTLVMAVVMIVIMIVTAGAAAQIVFGAVLKAIADVLNTTTKIASRMVRLAMLIMDIIISAIQVSADAVTLNNNVIMAKIDIIKGKSEAYSEEIQALIAVMQKLIAKLLELIQGGSTTLISISEAQGKKYTEASAISSDIFA